MRNHLIVGCGVAGIAAAEAIRSTDHSAGITIISEDPHGFYSRPGLAYYLTGELPQKQLYIYTKKDWQRLNVRFLHGKVTAILPREHSLELNRTQHVVFDRLLLATGATATRLDLPGGNLHGVVYLDNMEDTRQILRQARRRRTAVVVGGGILALELVEGLRAQGMQVHFFLRGDRYWPNVLDETESRVVEGRLRHEGVHIHPQTEISSILGRKNKVVGVRTTKGSILPCNLVAFGVGVRPRAELAQAAGLETERGILVNENMQTDQPDIFAAGDVAQVYDPETGQKVLDLLWYPGRVQGYIAGKNMSGIHTHYQRTVAINVLRLAGVMTSIIGAVGSRTEEDVSSMRGSSETWRQLPNTISVASGGGINQVRLVVGEKTLQGAVVMGEQTLSEPLQDLISARVDITSIHPQLLTAGPGMGQLLMDFWYTYKNKPTQE